MPMRDDGKVTWSSGLLTWVTGQNLALADDVAADLFGLDRDVCREGTEIETFLAKIAEADRSRVAMQLYRSIADGSVYLETFEVCAVAGRRRLALKGQAVGDVLFSCIVMEVVNDDTADLRELCFAAYDVARRRNQDKAAVHIMQTLVLIDETIPGAELH